MIQPDYPSALGLLAHLNSDELKEMLNDDTKFDSVLKDVKQVTIAIYILLLCIHLIVIFIFYQSFPVRVHS